MHIDPKSLALDFEREFSACQNLQQVETLRINYFGKTGLFHQYFRELATLDPELRRSIAADLNQLKDKFLLQISQLRQDYEYQAIEAELHNEKLDLTLPGSFISEGKLHPLSKICNEIQAIFKQMDFTFATGPDIEDDYHNFTALNIAKDHPARQMHDTFYLNKAGEEGAKLLRTHTSSVQIRWMKENLTPPYRLMSIGRTYRCDYDTTHTPMFHQFEGLVVEENVNMADLKTCLNYFLGKIFEKQKIQIRLRPSFFPFTEPSAEVDIGFYDTNHHSIKWLEILGCGMVHPNVLRNVGIDPVRYKGFAFGGGVERLAMIKYNITDLRQFFANDKRWLDQFNHPIADFLTGG